MQYQMMIGRREDAFPLAGFLVIMYGRFGVITEAVWQLAQLGVRLIVPIPKSRSYTHKKTISPAPVGGNLEFVRGSAHGHKPGGIC